MNRPWLKVAIAALLFRLVFLACGHSGWYVLPQNSLSKAYFLQGYAICAGWGYVRSVGDNKSLSALEEMAENSQRITPVLVGDRTSDLRPEMLHPPGTSLVIAAFHLLLGTRAQLPFEIFGALLDSAAACLVFVIASHFFSERNALWAGMIYAFFPPLAFISSVDKTADSLFPFFVIGCLACVVQSMNETGRKCWIWWSLGGILLGLGSYLRPDYLLMPVVIGLAVWVYSRNFRRSLLALGTVQCVAILCLVPWAYRNYLWSERWIFTSTSVGCTLITGLGEYNNPWGFGHRDQDREREAKEHHFESAWGSDADMFFRRLFWKSVRGNPTAYCLAVIKRVPILVLAPLTFGYDNPSKTELMSAARDRGEDRFRTICSQPWYVIKAYWEWLLIATWNGICWVCTAFMVYCERRRLGAMLLLLSPHLYSMGSHGLTHTESRFLLPSIFCLFFGAAYMMCGEWRRCIPH